MGGGFELLDILIFAGVALFLIYRLGSVLGKRTGHQKPPTDIFTAGNEAEERKDDDNVIHLPGANEEPEPISDELLESPIGPGLTQIKLADPLFDPDGFVEGSKAAFEMILGAFTEGDEETLRQLLSDEVFENFRTAIKAREDAGQRLEETLVGLDSAEIVEARMENSYAYVGVKFESQQVHALYDSDGRVIEGDPNKVTRITDLWVFSRNTRSNDPNWVLVETRVPE